MKSLPRNSERNLLAVVCFTLTLLTLTNPVAATEATQEATAAAALARPQEDQARDVERKPAEMMQFAQVKPGQTVIDFLPGKGYFTRLFSAAVGPQGAVYAVTPQFLIDKMKGRALPASVSLEPGYGNVHDAISSGATLNVAVKADLVWTSQNYHDARIIGGSDGTAQLNKAVFDVLKPGGLYIVLDHAAVAGQDDATMAKLHRIDRALVIKEIKAAGFVLDGESMVLRNPGDPHTIPVFDASIRGQTDQFILRFRKPAK